MGRRVGREEKRKGRPWMFGRPFLFVSHVAGHRGEGGARVPGSRATLGAWLQRIARQLDNPDASAVQAARVQSGDHGFKIQGAAIGAAVATQQDAHAVLAIMGEGDSAFDHGRPIDRAA